MNPAATRNISFKESCVLASNSMCKKKTPALQAARKISYRNMEKRLAKQFKNCGFLASVVLQDILSSTPSWWAPDKLTFNSYSSAIHLHLVVDSGRVEVVNLYVGVWSDGVSQRACILGKLAGTEEPGILDSSHCTGRRIGCEFLRFKARPSPKSSQTFSKGGLAAQVQYRCRLNVISPIAIAQSVGVKCPVY